MCPVKQCVISLKLFCLSRILVISGEIWILNFIEMILFFSHKESCQIKICLVFFFLFVIVGITIEIVSN